ncbi:hypothetical protein Lal_00017247 [Lupinus albus]|nr:hypothetical protein Lal_00017247 [Lupinus albus]
MDANEAKILLGFPPNSRPTPSQVKSAYKKKVWESHPDLFPSHEKPLAESRFKLVIISANLFKYWQAIPFMFYDFRSLRMPAACAREDCVLDFLFSFLKCGIIVCSVGYSRVVRTGVPRTQGGRKHHAMVKVPFILIILGTFALGGLNASRAYKKQKEEYPSHNPFLP